MFPCYFFVVKHTRGKRLATRSLRVRGLSRCVAQPIPVWHRCRSSLRATLHPRALVEILPFLRARSRVQSIFLPPWSSHRLRLAPGW